MVESLPTASDTPAGMSEAAAPLVTPLGHSLVIMNQGRTQRILLAYIKCNVRSNKHVTN